MATSIEVVAEQPTREAAFVLASDPTRVAEKQWSSQWWQCYRKPKLCIKSFIVPCYTAGQNAERLERNFWRHSLLCFVPFFGPYLSAKLRTEIRVRDSIPGKKWQDYLLYYTCPWCALVQEEVHLTELVIPNELAVLHPPLPNRAHEDFAVESPQLWTTFDDDFASRTTGKEAALTANSPAPQPDRLAAANSNPYETQADVLVNNPAFAQGDFVVDDFLYGLPSSPITSQSANIIAPQVDGLAAVNANPYVQADALVSNPPTAQGEFSVDDFLCGLPSLPIPTEPAQPANNTVPQIDGFAAMNGTPYAIQPPLSSYPSVAQDDFVVDDFLDGLPTTSQLEAEAMSRGAPMNVEAPTNNPFVNPADLGINNPFVEPLQNE